MAEEAGAGDVDAVLILGALAWCVALMIGVAMAGDGPMGPVLMLGGLAVVAALGVGVVLVPYRRRWRGDVRPRNTVRPRFEPDRPLKLAQLAVEERWGVTEVIGDRSWVREVGELRWRAATVFLVGDKTGLVVDPLFLARRAYVFDDTCRVAPSPTTPGLNPGLNLRRKNGVVRVSQGAQVIDLAIPMKSVPEVLRMGASAPADELVAVAVSAARLARIARADLRAARRHAFFARINALSKADRRVAAACLLFYLVLAAGAFIAGAQLGQFGANVVMLSVVCSAAVVVYAGRVIFQENDESSSGDEPGE